MLECFERQIREDEALYKCRLLLIEDPALELNPGLMWRCRILSSIESDGVVSTNQRAPNFSAPVYVFPRQCILKLITLTPRHTRGAQ